MPNLEDSKVFGDSEFYSGSKENIERILTMIDIGSGRLASLRDEQLRPYQKEADRIINARLNPFYAVPLQKDISGFYPEPIPYIAARIVSADVIHNEFTEIDANASEAAMTMKNNALLELDRMCNGLLQPTQILTGQRRKSRNRFARPTIAPLSEPPAARDR